MSSICITAFPCQPKDDWKLPGFAETQLDFFSRGQIRRFIDSWHRQTGRVQEWDADSATQRADLLKGAVFGRSHLSDLARRPLLLTLMCLLHTHHGSTLPERRAELYEQTVDLLLHRWERRQIVPGRQQWESSLSEWLRVDRTQVRIVLNKLAYDVHASQAELEGTANIDGELLEQRLLALGQADPDLRPVRLREFLDHRAGILLALGDNVFTFPHRTFQEYLAACHLTDLDEFADDMADLVRQDPTRWREVALLAGAKAAKGTAASLWWLAEALCETDVEADVTPSEMLAALIAGQAIVETANLTTLRRRGQRNVDRVRGWLKHILATAGLPAVERVTAGQVLAHLGDDRPGVGLGSDGLPDIAWCEVEAGEFTMGEDDEAHPVTLPTYSISRYTITNAQFAPFVEDGGYRDKWQPCWTEAGWEQKEQENWQKPRLWQNNHYNQANQPVVGVSWYECVAYCRWVSQRLRAAGTLGEDEEVRLPSEAEWEKAARGTDSRRYPWGNEADPDKANYDETKIGNPCAVGCFVKGVSPYGCQDMAGNVWEWCATRGKEGGRYELEPYPYQVTPQWSEEYLDRTNVRVLRGGAFNYDGGYVRSAIRLRNIPYLRYGNYGFRVVLAPIGSES